MTIKNEADFQKIQEITLQEDNIFDDLEFYEIRSEDLKNKISWEEMIKSKILQAPSDTKRVHLRLSLLIVYLRGTNTNRAILKNCTDL